jgi:hypothetical protein
MIAADPRQELQELRQGASKSELTEISLDKFANCSAGPSSSRIFASPTSVLVTQEIRRLNNWEFSVKAIDRLETSLTRLQPGERKGYVDSWYAALVKSIAASSECTSREVMARFNKDEFRGSDFRTVPLLAEDVVVRAQAFLRRFGFAEHAEKLANRLEHARDAARNQIENKLKAFHEYRAQVDLIRKIDDQNFLKRFVESSRGIDFGGSTPMSVAVGRVIDQSWLCSVAVDGAYDTTIRIEAAKNISDIKMLETPILNGINHLLQSAKLSPDNLVPRDLFATWDVYVLDRLIDRYVTCANKRADQGVLRSIIGYPYNKRISESIKLLTKEQLSEVVADLRDPQSEISRSLNIDRRFNKYSDVAYCAFCRLRLLKTGRELEVLMDIEPDAIDKMWNKQEEFLPVWPLDEIAEAAQRTKDGLKISEFRRQHHLHDALRLVSTTCDKLQEKINGGETLNEYQSAWLKTHNQIMASYTAECEKAP